MARQSGIKIENKFLRGLITERTGLNFEPGSCQETFNCVFDKTGLVTRRKGLDFEDDYVESIITFYDSAEPTIEFVWSLVGSTARFKFLVVQQGRKIYFFDISDNTTPSANKHAYEIDLNNQRPPFSEEDTALDPCSFAEGRGVLLVAHKYCDPFYVEYDEDLDTFTITSITLKERDFYGVDDELSGPEVRPVVSTVGQLFEEFPNHSYNLLNQGWYVGFDEGSTFSTGDGALTIGNWDDGALDLFIAGASTPQTAPNDYDQVSLYRADETTPFAAGKFLSKTAGSYLAPKGHFIINVGYPNRRTVLSEEFNINSLAIEDTYDSKIDLTGLTSIGNLNSNTANAFDEDYTQAALDCAQNSVADTRGWIGKTFSTPQKIFSATITGSTDAGYFTGVTDGQELIFRLYAKTGAAPAAWNDGTLLGSLRFAGKAGDESDGKTVISNDLTTEWDHVWVVINLIAGGSKVWTIGEVVLYDSEPPVERVDQCTFFAGRAWYAGAQQSSIKDKGAKIYFSQIIEENEQFGKCYQKQDPTNEYFFDLLGDDGGVIKILDMGKVVKMFNYQNALFIFAENGVWTITGGGGFFQADDYSIRKISSNGCFSPYSFVNVKGAPIWWGETGIYTVQYDLQSDNFTVVDMTENTIQSFFFDINTTNRRYAKGCYDPFKNTVYWLYRDGGVITSATKFRYNKVLCLNISSGAFYPWTISDHPTTNYFIKGITYINNAVQPDLGVVKLTTTLTTGGNNKITFSEFRNTSYYDWTSVDYSSYFISYYQLDGQTMNFFQTNYITVFMNVEADSSAYIQSLWDYTNSGNSGRWSNSQQMYKTNTFRDVVIRKLQLRGQGRSVQLRVRSEEGKPFNIIGWSLYESTNTIP